MSDPPRKPRAKKPTWTQKAEPAGPGEPVHAPASPAEGPPPVRRKVKAPTWRADPLLEGAPAEDADLEPSLGGLPQSPFVWEFVLVPEEEEEAAPLSPAPLPVVRLAPRRTPPAAPPCEEETPAPPPRLDLLKEAQEIITAQRPVRPRASAAQPGSRYEWVRVRPASAAVFFRQFATMYRAGIHIVRLLQVLSQTASADDPMMVVVCNQVGESVRQGTNLSTSLAAFPKVFTKLELNSIKVGETTGRLHVVLEVLAENRERQLTLTMKLRSALTYPGILFVIMGLMLVLGPPIFFEGLFKVMQDFRLELPLITRLLLAWSNLLRDPAALIVLLVVVVGGLAWGRKLAARPKVQLGLWRRLVTLPGVGRLLVSLTTARLAQSLEVLMASGVNMGTSLGLALESTGNPLVEERAPSIVDGVMNGQTLAQAFRRSKLFSPGFLHMLQAGEEAGSVVESLKRSARFYQWEFDLAVDSCTALLEPLMLLAMGLTVGIMIVATTLPFMELMKSL